MTKKAAETRSTPAGTAGPPFSMAMTDSEWKVAMRPGLLGGLEGGIMGGA